MMHATVRILMGVAIPIFGAAFILNLILGDFADFFASLGEIIAYGMVFMGVQALIASIIAEVLNRVINNELAFYAIATALGPACAFALVVFMDYELLWLLPLGAVMAAITAACLRGHYKKFSAVKTVEE